MPQRVQLGKQLAKQLLEQLLELLATQLREQLRIQVKVELRIQVQIHVLVQVAILLRIPLPVLPDVLLRILLGVQPRLSFDAGLQSDLLLTPALSSRRRGRRAMNLCNLRNLWMSLSARARPPPWGVRNAP